MKTPTPQFLIIVLIACLGLLQNAQAVSPPPDGCYPGYTTASGCNALQSLTTGLGNTGIGWYSLFDNNTGSYNTAIGAGALDLNTADNNTAVGAAALLLNTTGNDNTAIGVDALALNTTGIENTTDGAFALFNNTTGGDNTALGWFALSGNTDGCGHVAVGLNALVAATAGCSVFAANTAVGTDALAFNTTGTGNTGIGFAALLGNTTGGGNTAIGNLAGSALTTGDNNIDIGNVGAAGDSNTIRIGVQGTQTFTIVAGISNDIQAFGTPVIVTTDGYLGVATSSARFKNEVRQMDNASEALFALKPVTFHYKKEIDAKGIRQFGLVAEDVVKVNPDLVVRDKEGKPYSVRYDQVNAMLLNEFLKEHQTVQELKKQVAELTAGLQKVSAQLELSKSARRTVLNNQ